MILATAIAACSAPPSLPTTPAAVSTRTADQPAETAQAFVAAINQGDYAAALELTTSTTRQALPAASALQREYAGALGAATATSAAYQPRGLLQDAGRANVSLAATWQTSLFGPIGLTATLALTTENGAWRVSWTRDAIVQGLAGGTMYVERDVPPRGAIIAADGTTLAGLARTFTIGVQRGLIADAAEEAAMLQDVSALTGLSVDAVRAKYAGRPADWFNPVADVSEERFEAGRARLERYEAVIARPQLSRAYPQPGLAPHVTGYVGAISPEAVEDYRARGFGGDEVVGVSGLEASMNDVLMGRPGGKLLLLTDARRLVTLADRPFVRSRNVMVTLSPTLQLATQQILGQLRNRGAAVVMDARTGGVLAMASYPAFDLAAFSEPMSNTQRQQLLGDPARPLLNRAAQGQYPPGSAFKMVTMAAGIGERVTSPAEVFNDPGYWDGLGSAFRKTCWREGGHGRITLKDGLTASCNTVFYQVGKELETLNSAALGEYARRFGFGARTGIELPGEAAGTAPDPDWKQKTLGQPWVPGDTVNMAIGQGYMLATPLQIAQMTAAIANGGRLVRPRLVAALANEGERTVEPVTPPAAGVAPASDDTLRVIREAMAGVTTNTRIGTAEYRFDGFDYAIVGDSIVRSTSLSTAQRRTARALVVAGKTGTAQSPSPADKPHSWFTAFAPADDPAIVVTVMLENIGEGSSYAAPLARQIVESYYGLPLSTPRLDVRRGE